MHNFLYEATPSASTSPDCKAGHSDAELKEKKDFSSSVKASFYFPWHLSLFLLWPVLGMLTSSLCPIALPFLISKQMNCSCQITKLMRIRFQQLLLSSEWSSHYMFLLGYIFSHLKLLKFMITILICLGGGEILGLQDMIASTFAMNT